MLCCRIAAGGFALLAVSIVNASAQSCPLPWACQESRDADSTQNVKNNSLSQKGSLRIPPPDPRRLSAAESHQQLALRRLSQRDKMFDQEKRSHCSRNSGKRTKVARRQIKRLAMLCLMNFCDGKCIRCLVSELSR